jgi:peptidyl-prolyl cis-trans isomerase SurA
MLYSEDPGSAMNGGELGMTQRGNFVPEFDAVAFNLVPGEVSEIFETQFGFHIMKLIERRGDRFNAKHILLQPKVKREDLSEARKQLQDIVKRIENKELTFEEAAEKFSDDEFTNNNGGLVFNMETGSTKFDMDKLDSEIFFIIDKLKAGQISEPAIMQMRAGGQAYRVIKLINQTDPHIANMRDDYSMIQNAALSNKKEQEVMKWIKDKTKITYINIKDEFKDCKFENDWGGKIN